MKPGVTSDPSASSTRSPVRLGPSSATFPSTTRTSTACAGPPVPSITCPPLMTYSPVMLPPGSWLRPRAQVLELVTRAPGPRRVPGSPSSSPCRGSRETRRSRSGHRRATPRRESARDARRRPRRRSRGPGRSRGAPWDRVSSVRWKRSNSVSTSAGSRRAPEFATRIDATGAGVAGLDRDPPAVDVVLCGRVRRGCPRGGRGATGLRSRPRAPARRSMSSARAWASSSRRVGRSAASTA